MKKIFKFGTSLFMTIVMTLSIFISPAYADTPGSFTTYVNQDTFTTEEDIMLYWTASDNATSYGITVSKDPYGSANAVYDRDGVTGTSIDIGKLPAGRYRYNMLGRNSAGSSPLSSMTYFTVVEAGPKEPGTFTTYVNKDTFTTEEDIILYWTSSDNATSYGITVSKDPYGSANAVYDRDGVTGTSINIGKLPAGKYRYNMLGRNSAGSSPLSSMTYFTVVEAGPKEPGSFTTYVNKDTFTTEEDIMLCWTASDNATSYGITVSKDPYGSANAVYDRDGVTGTSINIGKLPVGRYRYNMLGRNSAGSSPLSSTTYFTIEEKQSQSKSPGSFNIQTDKESYSTTENIVVRWSDSANATSYNLIVAKEPNTSINIVVRKEGLTGNNFNIGTLQAGTYQMVITGINSSGGMPSSFAYFTVIEKRQKERKGYVITTNGDTLRVRSQASLRASILGTLSANTEVQVIGDQTNDFYHVKAAGFDGWCSADWIGFNKPTIIDTTTNNIDFVWPVPDSYKVNCLNYYQGNPAQYHYIRGVGKGSYLGAVDIDSNGKGNRADIVAIESGTIYSAKNNGAWGNEIIIRHDNGLFSYYAHLDKMLVTRGRVKKGQTIAKMGNTGGKWGVHLHFEIWNQKKITINTMEYFKKKYKNNIMYHGKWVVDNRLNPKSVTDWIKSNYTYKGYWYVAK